MRWMLGYVISKEYIVCKIYRVRDIKDRCFKVATNLDYYQLTLGHLNEFTIYRHNLLV